MEAGLGAGRRTEAAEEGASSKGLLPTEAEAEEEAEEEEAKGFLVLALFEGENGFVEEAKGFWLAVVPAVGEVEAKGLFPPPPEEGEVEEEEEAAKGFCPPKGFLEGSPCGGLSEEEGGGRAAIKAGLEGVAGSNAEFSALLLLLPLVLL